ncbi:MAG: hypothetical protein AAFN74_22770, partial [Myxococcota bacterium]
EIDVALSQHYGSSPPTHATPIPPHATPPDTLALKPSVNSGGRADDSNLPRRPMPGAAPRNKGVGAQSSGTQDRIPGARPGTQDRIPAVRPGTQDRIPAVRPGTQDRIPVVRPNRALPSRSANGQPSTETSDRPAAAVSTRFSQTDARASRAEKAPDPMHSSPTPTSDLDPSGPATRTDVSFQELDGELSSGAQTRANEWDLSVREWEGSTYTHQTDDLEAEGLGVAGTRKEVPDDESEPVTTSGPLDGHDWSSEVPFAHSVAISEIVPNERAPTITSTPDYLPDLEALPPVRSVDPRAKTTLESRGPSPAVLATTMEIPVAWDDDSHPFAGPVYSDVRVGLERTSIIPAADLGPMTFEPPPLDEPGLGTAMIGRGDIPLSAAEVEARQVQLEDIHEIGPAHTLEEENLEPISDKDVVPLDLEAATTRPEPNSDSARIPVIEPSRLRSLMDETDLSQEDTGADEKPLTDTSASLMPEPVVDSEPPEPATAVRAMLPSLDDDLRPVAPDRSTGPALKQPSTEATRHATSLVASLRSGQSLSSAQRAELVLALGRLLLDKGTITEAELLRALLE